MEEGEGGEAVIQEEHRTGGDMEETQGAGTATSSITPPTGGGVAREDTELSAKER